MRPKADSLGSQALTSLRSERPRETWAETRAEPIPENLSRPVRPRYGITFLPRASAFGLSPGLGSPGPLGRWKAQSAQVISRRVLTWHTYLAHLPGTLAGSRSDSTPPLARFILGWAPL
jgi:hypothetical protein